jgi:hypothetical protein
VRTHAPKDLPISNKLPIRAADISQMTPYFESINDLIGASQYRWSAEHLAGTPAPIAQRFGAAAR